MNATSSSALYKTWNTIYPAYIDANKSATEGIKYETSCYLNRQKSKKRNRNSISYFGRAVPSIYLPINLIRC